MRLLTLLLKQFLTYALCVYTVTGTYGFMVPTINLAALRNGWKEDMRTKRKKISPDFTIYDHARSQGKRNYVTVPK